MINRTLINNSGQVLLLFIVDLILQACTDPVYTDALPPDQSLEKFELLPGFQIEVFATEPAIVDPVELVFDEFGEAYAVEMRDYPYKPEPGSARSRIRYLEDSDHDGRIDGSIIFQDSLSEATSILPWEGGFIVTAAPEILFLKDTNGDHRADLKEVLFDGFFDNNSEAQITNLRFSPDNWIYAAQYGQPGVVRYLRKTEAGAVSVMGTDFRFRLDRGLFEPAAGSTQFGHGLDEWGHRFATQNTIHIQQIVIPWGYLNRNPFLSSSLMKDISDHGLEMFQLTPPPYWRAARTARRQKAYDEQNLDRTEYAEDHFTGCSGGTVYNGDAFPEAFKGSIFTGEVAGNLIHRDVINRKGGSPVFLARRDNQEKDREFLASTDPWFRPANLTVGPDGSLFVVDMYRQHIETPLSIPEDLKADMDFANGDTMGRIYRIVPDGFARPQSKPSYPGELATADLVPLLAHPNQWWRLTAQRLLLEREDTSVVELLRQMVGQHDSPVARLHALYTIEALEGLNQKIVRIVLNDPHPELRRHGMLLAERFPEMLPDLILMSRDTAIQVAFQAALSLGEFSTESVLEPLSTLLLEHAEDEWFRLAILSAPAASRFEFLQYLQAEHDILRTESSMIESFLIGFGTVLGKRGDPDEITKMLYLFSSTNGLQERVAISSLSGLLTGLTKTEQKVVFPAQAEVLLDSLVSNPSDKLTQMTARLRTYFTIQ